MNIRCSSQKGFGQFSPRPVNCSSRLPFVSDSGSRWLGLRRQGYNDEYRRLVTVDFTLSNFSTAILLQLRSELNFFFWWLAQLKGDRATTAIWELEIFGVRPSWKATGLQLQSRNSRFFGRRSCCNRDFLGGRPSWKMTAAIWELRGFALVASC